MGEDQAHPTAAQSDPLISVDARIEVLDYLLHRATTTDSTDLRELRAYGSYCNDKYLTLLHSFLPSGSRHYYDWYKHEAKALGLFDWNAHSGQVKATTLLDGQRGIILAAVVLAKKGLEEAVGDEGEEREEAKEAVKKAEALVEEWWLDLRLARRMGLLE